jgi:hypothetical protein
MTCKGYDPKAVKVSKEVKRIAASYPDPHTRGKIIRSYVAILEADTRQKSARNRGDK